MKKIIFAVAVAVFALGCSSSDDGGGGNTSQEAAVLLSPESNSECTSGTSVSATEVKVPLQWEAAPDTEKYFVYIKNLSTQNVLQFNAGTSTNFEATLLKGTPYSWYVSAVKTSGSSVVSQTWKFYVAGDAIVNYAPFPADLVAPAMSSSVYGPTVSLQWDGGDADDDVEEYRVYMSTNSNPETLVGTATQQVLNNVAVGVGNTYYWKVITVDEEGNTSTSPVFQFRVI